MMEREMNHKVGVKILADIQLENVMPTYNNLYQKIDDCRKVASKEMKASKRHYQYNFMYDNVFSILGKRGTGKTSVAFTLKEKIREKYEEYNDVVLPLIIPEVIPENCTVLGWLLAIVKEEVEVLEGEISSLEKKERRSGAWRECRYQDWEDMRGSLIELFDELSQLFYAGSYNPANEVSYYKAVDNSVKQAEDYYKFAKKIAELWDEWVSRIQHLQMLKMRQNEDNRENKNGRENEKRVDNQNKDGQKKDISCPMIYFIFDDVDLAPEKIEELLSVIIKYLSHPNIIVIVTADEELFLEVIENRLDQNIGRLPKEWRNYLKKNQNNREYMWNVRLGEKEEKADILGQTARMYLGKVLPTSTRFYLRLFQTAKQKELFWLDSNEKLGTGVRNRVQSLIDGVVAGESSKCGNFMEVDGKIINFYLKFMGNTSRQIGNVYIALRELLENLKKIVEENRKDTEKKSRENAEKESREDTEKESREDTEKESREDTEKEKNNADQEKLLMQIYQNCRHFLCVAINANHSLSSMVDSIDEFVDEVFLPEYNQWKMYCNYAFLNEYLRENFREESLQKRIAVGLQLYALFVFAENVLLILERGIPGGITQRKRIHAVSFLSEYIRETAFHNRYVFRSDLEPDVFFRHYMTLLDRMEIIVADEQSDIKFNMEYFYDFKMHEETCDIESLRGIYVKSRKWFNELAGMLAMVYGNAYLISEKDIEECMVYEDRIYLTRYQRRIDTEIRNNIRNCFYWVEMQEIWEEIEEMSFDVAEKDRGETQRFYEFIEEVEEEVAGKLSDALDIAGKGWVRLGKILDITFEQLKKYQEAYGMVDDFECFFHEIIEDVGQLEDNFRTDGEIIEEMMVNHIKEISEASVGRYAVLRDVENTMNVLGTCANYCTSLAPVIRDVRAKISTLEGEKNSVILERPIYNELLNVLTDILKEISQKSKNDDLWDDDLRLKGNVEELFGDLDLVIDPQSKEELKRAVELGMRVAFVKFLQCLYIFRLACERYTNGDSMSSRELEYVKVRGEEKETYYYRLFLLMVDIIGNEEMITAGKVRNVVFADMERDIRRSCRKERSRYVDFLFKEISNE